MVPPMKKSFLCCLAALAAGLALEPRAARADTFITDVGSGGIALNQNGIGDSDNVIGWRITVGALPIQVTDLGAWDYNNDGLGSAELVGLWRTSDQALLASATVPAGTAPALVNGFRFTHLTLAVTLQPNTSYTLGVRLSSAGGSEYEYRYGNNPVYSSTATFQFFGMNSGSAQPSANFAAQMPVNNLGDTSPLDGPNFQFVTVVPEPSTWAFLGLGVVMRCRRRITARACAAVSRRPSGRSRGCCC